MNARTKAIFEMLKKGRDAKVAEKMLQVFGASSLDECIAIYESVGNAERKSLDETIEHVTKDASAAFWAGVETRMV